jgi:hypothetical protein
MWEVVAWALNGSEVETPSWRPESASSERAESRRD